MNIVFLIGYVGRDPQVRSFPDGDRVAQISLATSKYRRNPATGAPDSATEWHRVRFYGPASGGLVDRVHRFVAKGSRIAVVGEISTSEIINAQGERIFITYIDVRRPDGLELLDRRRDTADRPAPPPQTAASPSTPAPPAGAPPAAGTTPTAVPASPPPPGAAPSAPHHPTGGGFNDGFDDFPLSDSILDGFDGGDPPF